MFTVTWLQGILDNMWGFWYPTQLVAVRFGNIGGHTGRDRAMSPKRVCRELARNPVVAVYRIQSLYTEWDGYWSLHCHNGVWEGVTSSYIFTCHQRPRYVKLMYRWLPSPVLLCLWVDVEWGMEKTEAVGDWGKGAVIPRSEVGTDGIKGGNTSTGSGGDPNFSFGYESVQ